MTRMLRAGLAVCVMVAIGTAVPGTAAAAPTCADPGELSQPIPWAQRALTPERVWPFTRGEGTKVAVLDSGVDANQPQLRGRVTAGFDAVAGSGPANDDCLGTGTQIAGTIAAGPSTDTGLVGLAPAVTIVPIRVMVEQTSGVSIAQPEVLARGIRVAVEQGADVIAVSTITYADTAELRATVANALARGVSVIAAVGDLGDEGEPNETPFPAQYPGVLGVGAIGPNGLRWPKSQHGLYVDLVGPGADVVALQRGQGMTVVEGTGVACGFVAAAAALVRARNGRIVSTNDINQILMTTTSPAAGRTEFGRGLVNPAAAVNDQVVKASPAPLPALPQPASAESSAWARSRTVALAGTGVALLVVMLVVLAAVTLPRGRRRFWRSALAATPPTPEEPDEPGPPLPLFDEQPVR